jgi:hypothetical protein
VVRLPGEMVHWFSVLSLDHTPRVLSFHHG